MEYLTTEDLLALAADLRVGPVQDLGLLDSAAHRPSASVFGRDAYLDIDAKAGALRGAIVVHHPLVDGNQRLGWLAVVVFYGLNGIDLWLAAVCRGAARRQPPAGAFTVPRTPAPTIGTSSASAIGPAERPRRRWSVSTHRANRSMP